jgi:hypothetical protein
MVWGFNVPVLRQSHICVIINDLSRRLHMFVGMFTRFFLPIRLLMSARIGRELALENLALRQQWAVMKRQGPRRRLPKTHRPLCFWQSTLTVHFET